MTKKIFMRCFCIIMLCVALVFSLTACRNKTDGQNSGNDSSRQELYRIETPYCTLFYPDDFYDFLDVQENEDRDTYTFIGKTEDEKAFELFTVQFAEEQSDESVGKIETGDAVVYVDVKFDELKLDGLDESTSNRLYAMQEGINTILDNLAKDSNYSNL